MADDVTDLKSYGFETTTTTMAWNSTDIENMGNINVGCQLKLGTTKSAVVVPMTTFALGVMSNSLAIVTLLCFLFRSPKKRDEVTSHQSNTSRGPQQHLMVPGNTDARRHSTPVHGATVKRKSRKVKFGPFHTLVLTLAVLDLAGTLFTSPITFILYFNESHILCQGGKPLCNYSAFAMMFFGFTTMAMVMTMSIERLMSIRHAYYYHRKATARKALLVVLGIFIFSALLCAMPTLGFGKVRPMFPYSWCFADWNAQEPKDKAFNFLYVSLGVTMLFVTLVCNARVIKGLVDMKKSSKWNRKSRRRTVSRETQMIIQLLVITLIFVVCWLPLMFRIFFNQLGINLSSKRDLVAIWLVAVNPILDPWVYILFRKSVARCVLRLAKTIVCFEYRSLKISPARWRKDQVETITVGGQEFEMKDFNI
ncbi:prostaglandin E2 receptor EP4 subtype-like [Ciona intestinalis]